MAARQIASAIVWTVVSLLAVAPAAAWAALALWFRLPAPDWAKAAATGAAGLVACGAIVALFTRARWKALGVFVSAFAAVALWFATIEPPANGDWAPDVARQTVGTLEGDILTLRDVRDFDWRSDSDFTERWSERSYDLSRLLGLDLFLAYWAGPKMAHLIMSFAFDDGQVLAWSIEVRRETNGSYSPVADAFKSHTLVYLATTERDSVRLRSNVRGEDVRLYRLRASPDAIRTLLLGYVAEANELKEKPAFYNSITTNCTTAVSRMIRSLGGALPFDWRLVVNGYLPSFLYDNGAVNTSIPLEELIERARINEQAKRADGSPDFSKLIRVGVPPPDGKPLM